MSLQSIVNVTIQKESSSVSRQGFGTPLIMSTEANALLDTAAKLYGPDVAELTADGFDPDGVTVKKFTAFISQNPKVRNIVIGKRSNPPLMTIEIVPVVKNSTLYQVTINGVDFEYTSDGTATLAEIIAGLVALINAGTENVLATNVGPNTSLKIQAANAPGGAATAGLPFTIEVNDRTILPQQNTTPDPGIVADLTTVRTAIGGNDDWYAVVLDSYGAAEIEALATHIETLRRIFLATTSDADVLTAADDDVVSTLQAAALGRTILIWHENPHLGASEAWAGGILPQDPGSLTWAFKKLVGVPYSVFTTSEEAYAHGKGCNTYTRVAGNNITLNGVVVGGEFIDVVRGLDFITARMEENVFGRFVALPKVPFTDAGIAVVENEVSGVLKLGIAQNILAADPAPTITVPKASEVDLVDKANRLLPDVNFTAVLAGAIHAVEIHGIVTV